MLKNDKTITQILIITLVGVTTLVMTVFGVIDYYREYNARLDKLHTKLNSITAQLSIALVNPMWTFNIPDISKIIESFMKDKEVYFVFTEDEKRFIGRIQNENGDTSPLHSKISSKELFFSETDIIFNGEKIGVLGVCLTTVFMKQELKRSLLYLLTSVFILNLSLISITFFVLMKTVFTPLKIIENYAIKMCASSGMEESQIQGKGFAKELKNLKNSIQDMIGQLKNRYLDLKKSQTALKEAEKKYREIFNNAVEGIFQTTLDGRLITANPALATILGYNSAQDILKSISNVVDDLYVKPSKRDDFLRIIDTKGRIQNFKTRVYRKDKSIISVSITAHSVFDDNQKLLYYEGVLENITQKRKAEELKIAKEAAEASTRAKNVFLASMSHEIRTPMNAILGLSDLALKTNLTTQQQDYIEKIGMSAHDLLGIINDILDFSKIEAGELNIDHVDFLLDDIWENLSDLFTEKSKIKGLKLLFAIEENIPPALIGDPLRVKQILINLIGNALKFTQKGKIIVRVSLVEKTHDRVILQFSVKDTGIGIDQEKLTTIFAPFTQVEPFITRKYSGTGLGLSICKQLINMMDGKIWAKSKRGHGSCFNFTTNFGLQPEGQEPEFIRSKKNHNKIINMGDFKGIRILLVEDNSINRQVAVEILESRGIIVTNAENGMEAINIFSSRGNNDLLKFDAVIMDVQMPGMNGFEATRQIRQIELKNLKNQKSNKKTRIPIITMTAHAMIGDREKCISSGMDDYIAKPIDQDRLFKILKKWIPLGADRPHAAKKEDGSIEKTKENENDPCQSDCLEAKALPEINFSKGLKRLQGNKKLYLKLLHEFVQNHADDIKKIKQAVEKKDIELAQRQLHTFKGVVKSIAADHLAQITQNLEEMIKQNKTLKTSFLDDAQKIVTRIADSINSLPQPLQKPQKEYHMGNSSLDIKKITPGIIEMYQLLGQNRIDADKYLGSLKEFLTNSGFEADARKLDISLSQFNFKETRTVMEKIARQLNISLERRDI
ncbi:MAG: response regulator [Desulfobacteraceae bacterium]|nr:response regulator [Desulfobacteraceae bacterium]